MTRPPVPKNDPMAMNSDAETGEQDGGLDSFLNIVTSSRPGMSLSRNARAGRSFPGAGQATSVVVAGVDVEAGDALGPEHRHVAAVVLERQAQVEAGGPQLPDRRLLEVARRARSRPTAA